MGNRVGLKFCIGGISPLSPEKDLIYKMSELRGEGRGEGKDSLSLHSPLTPVPSRCITSPLNGEPFCGERGEHDAATFQANTIDAMVRISPFSIYQVAPLLSARSANLLIATFAVCLSLLIVGISPLSAQPAATGKTPLTSKDFGKKPNRLAREASPYLRMHAKNPVDWYPWGPEALQKALTENKPIFLSIGYSTCFWCHVMERKVFENPEIAAYMNEHFINIKVDREERPDIDDVYMTALQVYFQLARSSQGGGWPLSMFLTPQGKPIAGGTYFPPEDIPGRTGFPSVMRQIQGAWATREKDVLATAEIITKEVARLSVPPMTQSATPLSQSLVDATVQNVAESYDPEYGGFDFDPENSEGSKFPVPCRLQLLQAQIGRNTPEREFEAAAMLDATLTQMAGGGIWDHLGGGFHRYSVDRRWHVPHFEKMLYDNAQLAEIYVDAYRRTGREQYRQIAEGIFSFVKQEMTGPRGEFYTALDAETDGIEGAYYVWSKIELEKTLSAGDLRIFSAVYGVDEPSPLEAGIVLHRSLSLPDIAQSLGMPVGELELRLTDMKKRLLAVRQKRPPLIRDDKVLTAWNGLMIRAYARAGQVLKRQDYLTAAEKAAVHLLTEHRDAAGGLLRTDAKPPEQQPAFLEDYAFLISGLIALHDATREEKWLNAARRLMDEQIGAFWDNQRGGFFYTARTQEVVLARQKTASDSVMPSGNSMSAQNLIRLSRLKTSDTYKGYAEKTFLAFSAQLKDSPSSSPYLALALQEYLHWYGAPETQAAGEGLFAGGLSSPARTQQMESATPKEPRPSTAVPPESKPPGMTPVPPSSRPSASPPEASDLLVAFKPSAESPPHPRLQARGFLAVDQLTPGSESQVAIELVIEPGWHLNANPPRPDFVVPLTIQLKGSAGFELKDVKYPAWKDYRVNGIDEVLSVYEGRIVVQGTLVVPSDAKESVSVDLELRLQMCDDQRCLPREMIKLTGTLPVAPSSSVSGKAINASLFQEAVSPPAARPFP